MKLPIMRQKLILPAGVAVNRLGNVITKDRDACRKDKEENGSDSSADSKDTRPNK